MASSVKNSTVANLHFHPAHFMYIQQVMSTFNPSAVGKFVPTLPKTWAIISCQAKKKFKGVGVGKIDIFLQN